MDSGSDISIVEGNLFYEFAKERQKVTAVGKRVNTVNGSTDIIGSVMMEIETAAGKSNHKFYGIPDNTRQVILGFDFVTDLDIGLSARGWFRNEVPEDIFSFAESQTGENCKAAQIETEKSRLRNKLLASIGTDENKIIETVVLKHFEKGVFSDKLGLLNTGEELDIEIEKGPSYQAPMIPLNTKMSIIMDIKIQELLVEGVIEPSQSHHLCAPILVKKSGGPAKNVNYNESDTVEETSRKEAPYYRLCLDLRPINARLINVEPYAIPSMDFILSRLSKAKYFTVIDLKSGFLQVPVKESARQYLALRTLRGIYQYKRVPFGSLPCLLYSKGSQKGSGAPKPCGFLSWFSLMILLWQAINS